MTRVMYTTPESNIKLIYLTPRGYKEKCVMSIDLLRAVNILHFPL